MPLAWIVLVLSVLLAAPLVVVSPRREAREDLRGVWPFAALVALVVLGCAGAFRFYQDDYQYLVLARVDPFAVEPQRRLLGVQLPFFLAGGSAVGHVSLNLLALGGLVAAFGALLRTGGWTRREALVAGLLLASSAPVIELLPWAAGFQQLAAWAAVFGAAAAMSSTARPRWACVLGGAGLSMLVVVIKWPLAPLAPLVGWLFGALAGRRAPHVAAAASAIAVGVGLALVAPPLESFGAGSGGVLSNLAEVVERLRPPVRAALIALVVVAALAAPSRERFVDAFFLGRSSRDAVRIGVVLGVVSLGPFLFNARYFAAYYVGPALAFVAAPFARALVALAPAGRTGAALALLFAVAWFPARAATERWTDPRYAFTEASLADASHALAEAPASPEIGVIASCDGAALDRIWEGSEGEWGLRWASGRLHTRFVRAPRPTTLVYCGGFHLEIGRRR
ncbi:MAG: hypothetical protein KC619_01280 [Myxococcales bacterium]|nr:hypothetical protein [Myxococcales bacterium]